MSTEPHAHRRGARPLDYAPPRGRSRRQVVMSLLPLLVLAVPLAAGWVMPYVQRARELSAQDDCLEHALPPGTVVYTDDAAEQRRLLSSGGGRAAAAAAGYARGPAFVGAADTVTHTPSAWARYDPHWRAGDGSGLAFLHEMRSPGGNVRLVAVEVRPGPARGHDEDEDGDEQRSGAEGDGAAAVARSVAFAARVIRPATLGSDRHDIHVRANLELLDVTVAAPDCLRLFAGQRDPADASRFTIRYTLNGTPGVLDGALRDDDHVVLAPRDGPAAGPAWSSESDPTVVASAAATGDGGVATPGRAADDGEALAPEQPPPAMVIYPGAAGMKRGRAVRFPYDHFVAVREGGDVVMLRLRLDAGRHDSVTCDWFVPAAAGAAAGPAGRGTGRTPAGAGKGVVRAGPFELEWSDGGGQSGWVYFPAARPKLVISRKAWPTSDAVNLAAPDVSYVGPAAAEYNR